MTVRPEGDIFDRSARELRERLLELTTQHRMVVVDLARVTFFASEGVSALVAALRHATSRGHELCVQVVRGTFVQRVLEICGIPFALIEPDAEIRT